MLPATISTAKGYYCISTIPVAVSQAPRAKNHELLLLKGGTRGPGLKATRMQRSVESRACSHRVVPYRTVSVRLQQCSFFGPEQCLSTASERACCDSRAFVRGVSSRVQLLDWGQPGPLRRWPRRESVQALLHPPTHSPTHSSIHG